MGKHRESHEMGLMARWFMRGGLEVMPDAYCLYVLKSSSREVVVLVAAMTRISTIADIYRTMNIDTCWLRLEPILPSAGR